jgi:hypothetical protein
MYNVGQVLYVILEKKRAILPVRVTEQIVRRTVEGESISYKVSVPGKNQVVSLADLGSSHHSSLDDVEQELLSNAKNMIHTMAGKAKSIAQEFFQTTDEVDIVHPLTDIVSDSNLDTVKVDLGNGTLANVDLSGIGVPK